MEEKSGAIDTMGASVESKREMILKAIAGSRWNFECYDKDGNLKWEELDRPNIITDEGFNAWLNIMFHGATPITTWYIIPVETDTTAATTMTNSCLVSSEYPSHSVNKATYTSTETKTLYGGALVGGGTHASTISDPPIS